MQQDRKVVWWLILAAVIGAVVGAVGFNIIEGDDDAGGELRDFKTQLTLRDGYEFSNNCDLAGAHWWASVDFPADHPDGHYNQAPAQPWKGQTSPESNAYGITYMTGTQGAVWLDWGVKVGTVQVVRVGFTGQTPEDVFDWTIPLWVDPNPEIRGNSWVFDPAHYEIPPGYRLSSAAICWGPTV